MNKNFILGCLAGAIGGMLGAWMLLFVDIKIKLRESPVLNINTGYNSVVGVEEISIPNPEDGEDENAVGVFVNDGLLEELVGEFKERGRVGLVLIPDSHTNTSREGEGVHVVISPVPTGDIPVQAKVIGFRLLDGRGEDYYKK